MFKSPRRRPPAAAHEDELHRRIIGQRTPPVVSSLHPPPARGSQLAEGRRPRSSSPARPASERLSCPRRSRSSCSGDDDALIQMDMRWRVRRPVHCIAPVGRPPGYVGYEEGGQFTEGPPQAVLRRLVRRRRRYPDIFNTLLQITEDGRFTDGQGRVVDSSKNTVLIATIETSARVTSEGRHGLGRPVTPGGVELRADEVEGLRRAPRSTSRPGWHQPRRRRCHRLPP